MSFHVPERYRERVGPYGTTERDGNNGRFFLPPINGHRRFFIIASDGDGAGAGWEHVSVHMFWQGDRCQDTPTWSEMCHIKSVFWDPEDVVMQLHPARSEYVNNHEHVLHLWRPVNQKIPTPPAILVGIKEAS